ncbi:hypothetical protein HMPREF0321_1414 [Dermacoccus sp. Ellin185]|nr:hypothetical protein HMPREF0321_1414 [Dermacoccus sp. Ellin185]
MGPPSCFIFVSGRASSLCAARFLLLRGDAARASKTPRGGHPFRDDRHSASDHGDQCDQRRRPRRLISER